MGAQPAPGLARRGSAAIAASLLAHACLFTVLVWQLEQQKTPAEAPSVDVQLVRLPRHKRPPAPEPAPARSEAPPRDATLPPERPPPPMPTEIAPAPPPGGRADGVQQALRGRLGCANATLMRLTKEERERCREQLARGGRRDPSTAGLDLNRRGDFTVDDTPYLIRRPKNGCKVGAGGDTTPSGEQGAAGGVSCAWQF
jgi:hypothetical protein